MSTSRLFSKKQLWVWPVVAAALLVAVGWWLRSVVEGAVKHTMAGDLRAILEADVTALRVWLETQEEHARAVSENGRVRDLVTRLVALAEDRDGEKGALLTAPETAALREELEPWLVANDYDGFVVLDRSPRVVAALRDDPVGLSDLSLEENVASRLFAGKPTIVPPMPSAIVLETEGGTAKAGVATMFAAAPVRDERDEVIAVLALRIRPERDFTRILGVARAGETGETYAFDSQGLLLSQSRFDEDLKQIGLLVDRDDVRSILNLEIRDPGVDMTQGERPVVRRKEQPLTRMAGAAVAGESGVDVDGYRDYRGVPVIGAWTWLPEYGFGVATEVDVAEAYRPLYLLRTAFWGLFALLAASAGAIFVFTIVVARLQRSARRAAVKAQQLGQYHLEEKIGAGGMGVVYRGQHAMLRRPTAIKLLDVEKTTEQTIARFEREVQLTSQLCHPNTIAVYDYGRTPEGVFYYAMEYLDGVTLEQLVSRHGPQPSGRVIHVLRQVCGSLIEAHGIGLIHRDIKPANIVLNRRGGVFDFVKLLDFGLVKAVDSQRESGLTAAGSMTGTPMYLSPEGIETPDEVDARSDLYAVGAVGYFLLTGRPVFDGRSVVEICMQQVNAEPVRPSERLEHRVDDDLEKVVLRCLQKDPGRRFQHAKELLHALEGCRAAGAWTQEDAERWWHTHDRVDRPAPPPTGAEADTAAHERTMIVDGSSG